MFLYSPAPSPLRASTVPSPFIYGGKQANWWQASQKETIANGNAALTSQQSSLTLHKLDNPKKYQVFISGNFASTILVRGMGSGSSQTISQSISVASNTSLTFTCAGFGAATDSNGVSGPVQISYSFVLLDDTGAVASGPILGLDAAINGQVLTLTAKNKLISETLQINRTITTLQTAAGASSYVANGTLVMSVN